MNEIYKDVLFILGNGFSRKDLDVPSLCALGRVVGCNYVFRESMNVSRVAIQDKSCIDEALKAGLPTFKIIDRHGHIKGTKSMVYDFPVRTLDTGQLAVWAGVKCFRPSVTYLLGFDFVYDRKRSNVHDPDVMYSNVLTHDWEASWLDVLSSLDTKFIRVGERLSSLNELPLLQMPSEAFYNIFSYTKKESRDV